MMTPADATTLAPEDRARTEIYGLLAHLLSRPPTGEMLSQLGQLEGDDTPFGRAIAALAATSATLRAEDLVREYNKVFIGLGRGEVLPYASYYLTGFLNEKPLAVLRQDMQRLGVTRATDVYEPEDNIATLCDIMAGIVGVEPVQVQRDFFSKHIGNWAGYFFRDLAAAPSAQFYKSVAGIGAAFVKIEAEAFRTTMD